MFRARNTVYVMAFDDDFLLRPSHNLRGCNRVSSSAHVLLCISIFTNMIMTWFLCNSHLMMTEISRKNSECIRKLNHSEQSLAIFMNQKLKSDPNKSDKALASARMQCIVELHKLLIPYDYFEVLIALVVFVCLVLIIRGCSKFSSSRVDAGLSTNVREVRKGNGGNRVDESSIQHKIRTIGKGPANDVETPTFREFRKDSFLSFDILYRAWECAWAEEWDKAGRLIQDADKMCQHDAAGHQSRILPILRYIDRVKSRNPDPRRWNNLDVADFFQSHTKRTASASIAAGIDGATLIARKRLLLSHWAGSDDFNMLEKMNKILDDMVSKAEVKEAKSMFNNTLGRAWEYAWAEDWAQARRLVQEADKMCQHDAERQSRILPISEYIDRRQDQVKSRNPDPRRWNNLDVADFFQSHTKRTASASIAAGIDGATLIARKRFLLSHWARSDDFDLLKKMNKILDDMVSEALINEGKSMFYTTLGRAWEYAWAEEWAQARRLVQEADKMCQHDAERQSRILPISQYMDRVKIRNPDPRRWNNLDVADFFQSHTRQADDAQSHTIKRTASVSNSARILVDGATLIARKRVLLSHWARSDDFDMLEKINKILDDMVSEAEVKEGSLCIENAKIIKQSNLCLEEKMLGSGSSADVYPGVWTARGKQIPVAVKILRSVSSSGVAKVELQKLIMEVEYLRAAAASEHVVKYYGVVLGPGQRCGIVMDLEFCSLYTVLEEKMLEETHHRLRMLLDTALGLRGIHKADIQHGDIKPSNLLLSSTGRIKIADFSNSGSTSTLHSESFQVTQNRNGGQGLSGTFQYVSPEAWSGCRTKASDVWAFGMIVWHILTGKLSPWADHEHLDVAQIMFKVVNQRETPQVPSGPNKLKIPQPICARLEALYRECCEFDGRKRPVADRLVLSLEELLELHLKEIRRPERQPSTWSRCEGGDPYEVRRIRVEKGSAEYADVERCFACGCRGQIQQIERIQNLEQWCLYRQKLQAMETRATSSTGAASAGPNEKRLFHGTQLETVALINQKSFNRSYCGRNATAYGRGTYFATSSSYSAQDKYSPKDANGHKYMYLALVLVGASVVGRPDMREPPQLPGDSSRTYDSTCDRAESPRMYVVYHDAQAYPEYLITFTAA
jgi:serine/threonine protein kinase